MAYIGAAIAIAVIAFDKVQESKKASFRAPVLGEVLEHGLQVVIGAVYQPGRNVLIQVHENTAQHGRNNREPDNTGRRIQKRNQPGPT